MFCWVVLVVEILWQFTLSLYGACWAPLSKVRFAQQSCPSKQFWC